MEEALQGSDRMATIRKRSIANPGYRVRLCPTPVVIDRNGEQVPDAFVVAIHFPRQVMATSAGRVPVVTAAGAARILVGEATIRKVPIC